MGYDQNFCYGRVDFKVLIKHPVEIMNRHPTMLECRKESELVI